MSDNSLRYADRSGDPIIDGSGLDDVPLECSEGRFTPVTLWEQQTRTAAKDVAKAIPWHKVWLERHEVDSAALKFLVQWYTDGRLDFLYTADGILYEVQGARYSWHKSAAVRPIGWTAKGKQVVYNTSDLQLYRDSPRQRATQMFALADDLDDERIEDATAGFLERNVKRAGTTRFSSSPGLCLRVTREPQAPELLEPCDNEWRYLEAMHRGVDRYLAENRMQVNGDPMHNVCRTLQGIRKQLERINSAHAALEYRWAPERELPQLSPTGGQRYLYWKAMSE